MSRWKARSEKSATGASGSGKSRMAAAESARKRDRLRRPLSRWRAGCALAQTCSAGLAVALAARPPLSSSLLLLPYLGVHFAVLQKEYTCSRGRALPLGEERRPGADSARGEDKGRGKGKECGSARQGKKAGVLCTGIFGREGEGDA